MLVYVQYIIAKKLYDDFNQILEWYDKLGLLHNTSECKVLLFSRVQFQLFSLLSSIL